MSQKQPKRRLPKRVQLSPDIYAKVELQPGEDIQGDDGEWVPNLPPTKGCGGIMRVDKTLDEHERWRTYRHELFHAVIDIHEWIAGHPEDEEDPEDGNGTKDDGDVGGDSQGGVRAPGPEVGK